MIEEERAFLLKAGGGLRGKRVGGTITDYPWFVVPSLIK
jgi:hypothetical protein